MLIKRRSKSIFGKFVLICCLLTLITCIVIGAVLGSVYLKTINRHNGQMIESQVQQAVSALDAQFASMHALSLRLSTQSMYRPSYVHQNKYNTLQVARSLKQYASYCTIAGQFALMYPMEDNSIFLLQQDGTTADFQVFLARYGLTDNAEIRTFLFDRDRASNVYLHPSGAFFAFPVTEGSGKVYGTLCFCLQAADIREHVRLSSTLDTDNCSVYYQNTPLLSHTPAGKVIAHESKDGLRIEASVFPITLPSLIQDPAGMLRLTFCLLILFASIFSLAWLCYYPIRSLSRKHSEDTRTGTKNELQILDQIISQTKSQTVLLDKKASDQSQLLKEYVLLMLLNNSGSSTIKKDLDRTGITFPHSTFGVIALTACRDQFVTREHMQVLCESISDIVGDLGTIQTVIGAGTGYMLTAVCNVPSPAIFDVILQRLTAYLNAQTLRFIVGVGSVTDRFAGISASYLAALSELRTMADEQSDPEPAEDGESDEAEAILRRLIAQIECGDQEQALSTLDTYINAIDRTPSELSRRYSALSVASAVQQLCAKICFPISETHLSVLLSMRSVQTIHYALLQLIPELCSHVRKKISEAVRPTGMLVMDYLNKNFCNYDISVQNIATAVGIGINRASAIIQEETGLSFKAVLTSLRISHAKKLLAAGISVSDVAEKVGYSSASYFIKVFKASEGATPDAYRKSLAASLSDEKAAGDAP